MARTAMFFGVLLIALGLIGYFAADTLGDPGTDAKSPTALIPAAIGLIIFICGAVVSANPKFRKHVMHLAVLIGLLGAIGGFMPLVMRKFNFDLASVRAGLVMIVLCALFVLFCVRSFVLARIARAEGLPDVPHDERR